MALWWGGVSKGQRPLPTFLSERKLMPSSHFDARHFSSSLYASGTFQVATPVLEYLIHSNIVDLSKSMCRFFKGNCLGLQKFLPLTQYPWFLQPEIMGTYLTGTGTLGWGAWYRVRTPCSRVIPPKFLCTIPNHVYVGPAHPMSLHPLPVWMDVVSLIP